MSIPVSDCCLISKSSCLFPNRPAIATIWRWATRGVRGVILRTMVVGGRRYVTPRDVAEFLETLNTAPPRALEKSQAPGGRGKRAAESLARAGF